MLVALALTLSASAADVRVEVDPGRLNRGLVAGVVDAPIEQVVAVVEDCEGFDQWFPDMIDTRPTGVDRCRGATNLPWPLADRQWEVSTGTRVELVDGVETWILPFEYVEGSGNLVEMRGEYRLSRIGSQTRVEYEAWIDVGFWVPECLLSWATERLLPGMVDGLELAASAR